MVEIDTEINISLRLNIAMRVKQAIKSKTIKNFVSLYYSYLGYAPVTMRDYIYCVRTGKRIGENTKVSNSMALSSIELKKLGILFNILDINEDDQIVKDIISSYPEFFEDYKSGVKLCGNIRRFDQLSEMFYMECERQTLDYFKNLRAQYNSAEKSEQRDIIISDLECNLNFIEGEGLFSVLNDKEDS